MSVVAGSVAPPVGTAPPDTRTDTAWSPEARTHRRSRDRPAGPGTDRRPGTACRQVPRRCPRAQQEGPRPEEAGEQMVGRRRWEEGRAVAAQMGRSAGGKGRLEGSAD